MSSSDRGLRMSTSLARAPSTSNLIYVIKQSSPFVEKITRNGIQKEVYVVIKNSPFILQIGKTGRAHDVDLNRVAFEVTLFYDTEGEKNVDFVKSRPIEFKALPSDAGDQATIEIRIKVLTSQHEDMFFRARLQGYDPVTKAEIPDMRCCTEPIKVISKPEQLKKRQPTKKRTLNDMVVDAITRIERQQNEQQGILHQILEGRTHDSLGSVRTAASVPAPSPKDTLSGAPFEALFSQVLKQFATMDTNQKAERIRRVVRDATAREAECLSELVDMLSAQGLGNDLGHDSAFDTLLTPSQSNMSSSQPSLANPLGLTHVIPFAQVPFPQYTHYNHIHLEKDCSCQSTIPSYTSSTSSTTPTYSPSSSSSNIPLPLQRLQQQVGPSSIDMQRTSDMYVATSPPVGREDFFDFGHQTVAFNNDFLY
eukprot:TRINITY_DN538_c0_g1_i6.p1 TRINITY_DN538_c0_g1~~TRINITY_DN538_c0_g1_i6.p1  ORF type:complete len:423 (-),score=141.65 TRINITY_DN538_c0_g1_i6:67-1335(-)